MITQLFRSHSEAHILIAKELHSFGAGGNKFLMDSMTLLFFTRPTTQDPNCNLTKFVFGNIFEIDAVEWPHLLVGMMIILQVY